MPGNRTLQYAYDGRRQQHHGNHTRPGRPAPRLFAYSANRSALRHTRPPDIGIGKQRPTQYTFQCRTGRSPMLGPAPDGQLIDLTYDAAGRIKRAQHQRGGLISYNLQASRLRC